MMEIPPSGDHLIDVVLWVWFALTALAVAYVAQDQFKGGPEEKSPAMKTEMELGVAHATMAAQPPRQPCLARTVNFKAP